MNNGTGIAYPELTLGGTTYTVQFSRGSLLYRLSRKGILLSDLQNVGKRFAALFDVLHAILQGQYTGTAEELAALAYEEDKLSACDIAVGEALKKVFPPTPAATPVGTSDQAAQIQ